MMSLENIDVRVSLASSSVATACSQGTERSILRVESIIPFRLSRRPLKIAVRISVSDGATTGLDLIVED